MNKIISLICALFLASCSNSKEVTNVSDGGAFDAGSDADEVVAKFLPGAIPCAIKINSGFDGDDQCIEAPNVGTGFQLYYGPSDYDNPDELNKFLMAPGDEYVDCLFRKTPNTSDVFVNQYHARLRPGTHHMITYIQPELREDSVLPEPCRQGASFTFLVGATTITTDISGTSGDSGPEYAAAAMPIPAQSQTAIQMHYVNTSSESILKEGWINVIYFNDEVDMVIHPITWIGGLGMSVPPLTKQIVTAGGDSCIADRPLNIITLVGHAHANTERVTAFIDKADGARDLVYETYDWSEPGFISYNSAVTNDSPDSIIKQQGGWSGVLSVEPGDRMSWECEVNNQHQDVTLVFSDRAYDGEMCNMFGVYGPSMGGPWSCFSL